MEAKYGKDHSSVSDDGIVNFKKQGDVAKINWETGKIVWEKDQFRDQMRDLGPDFRINAKNGTVESSKALVGYTMNGSKVDVKWKLDIPPELGELVESENKPFGVINCKNGLMRVDLQTGKVLWTNTEVVKQLGGGVVQHVSLLDGHVFVGWPDGRTSPGKKEPLGFVDLETGRTEWVRDDMSASNVNTSHVHGSKGTRFVSEDKETGSPIEVIRLDKEANIAFRTSDIWQTQISALKEMHIDHRQFFSKEYVDHVIANRRSLEAGDVAALQEKPITIIFKAKSDWNGGLVANNDDELMHKSNVLHFEIGSDQEMLEQLSRLQKLGIQVDTLILRAHGSRSSMLFGDLDYAQPDYVNDPVLLDISDGKDFEPYAPMFRGAQIFALGCSVGAGKQDINNIVNMLAGSLGKHASSITGAAVEAYGHPLIFDKDSGEVTGVEFSNLSKVFSEEEVYTIHPGSLNNDKRSDESKNENPEVQNTVAQRISELIAENLRIHLQSLGQAPGR
jgi:outer membrane protein assembly factor BamB